MLLWWDTNPLRDQTFSTLHMFYNYYACILCTNYYTHILLCTRTSHNNIHCACFFSCEYQHVVLLYRSQSQDHMSRRMEDALTLMEDILSAKPSNTIPRHATPSTSLHKRPTGHYTRRRSSAGIIDNPATQQGTISNTTACRIQLYARHVYVQPPSSHTRTHVI